MRALRVALYLIAALAAVTVAPTMPSAQIGVSITLAPPALPVYAQPAIPGAGYIWTPGYWAWGPDGYYWVPGTWVLPPAVGVLWTPGYWGWSSGAYIWNGGYWGPHIGFYGGINYGFGYTGIGYAGGYWNNGAFFYNRSVNNISNTNITNVYTKNVTNNINNSKVSFNGPGGATAKMTAAEAAAARQPHTPPTPLQVQHREAAAKEPTLRASVNHGVPPVAATAKPGVFSGPAVVPARAGPAPTPAATRTAPPVRTPAKAGTAEPARAATPRTTTPPRPETPAHVVPPRPATPAHVAPPRPATPAHVAPVRPVAPHPAAVRPAPPRPAPHPAAQRAAPHPAAARRPEPK